MKTIRLPCDLTTPPKSSRHDIEDAVISSLARHGLSAMFAVIPFASAITCKRSAPIALRR